MPFVINEFRGMLPKIPYQRKPLEFADLAKNCKFDTGNLTPINGLYDELGELKNSGFLATIFLHKDNWLSFNNRTSVVTSPIAQDTYDRVYWSDGVGKPQVAYGSMVNTSNADPTASFDLGIPAPASPILIESITNNEQNTQDYADDETRFYTYTYVSEAGEEGPQAPLSAEVTILDPKAEVNLTIPVIASNTANITSIRVYRSVTSISSADFLLVAEVPIASASLLDNFEDNDLGKILDTSNSMPPPNDLQGLTKLPNGILAGFTGKTLCFSDAYLPYSWPVGYQLTTNHNIIGIAAFGGGLLIATDGYPEIAFGARPDSMTLQKSEINEPCVSPDSIVDMGDYVVYASKNGLVSASSNGFRVLTKELITADQWKSYLPNSIKGVRWQNKYLGFYSNNAGFIFDLETGSLTHLDFYASATFYDLFNDKLYLLVGNSLKSLSGSNKQYTWSKRFELNGRVAPSVLKIESLDYDNLQISYLVDGIQRVSGDLGNMTLNSGVLRLPALRGKDFEIVLTGTSEVERLILGNSMSEVRS